MEPLLAQGRDVLLEIDWQGARQVRAAACRTASASSSCRRRARNWNGACARARSDNAETIARRLADSRGEIAHADDFDYIVVNDQFADALADLRAIVASRRLRSAVQLARHARADRRPARPCWSSLSGSAAGDRAAHRLR